jgi:hypothetical protein
MNQIIKQNGINFGLILGFLLILPPMLGYAFNVSILVSYWTLVYIFLIVIIVGIIEIAFTKKALEGIISFKDAFTSYFLMLVISVFISTVLNFVLFNFIDKDFGEVVKEKQVELIESQRDWTMNKMGNAPQEKIDEIHDKFDEAIEKVKNDTPYAIGAQLKGAAIFLAIFSMFGLLLALILKKKDPALD